ncbi:zf-HC2 domain-containing protein [Candidatus Poribacteria bacterium]|jgi:hypothetical protein|nr:zf-HC2 domain-containing protein [Candidatus Poribacteria bacterium]MBT5535877.1 zf-HC2 domain-containing protein [Candidatus Poribacteria bacterium]MBT5711842.1 zf-HC2 domain-containing protein [Candidatus Poribacteria bacterium]MBT7096901.1 zf-HC2 domain-containing protein [Candidatus Poribacteria bacterium]MBT7804921.1 zf-HC2 domain-containing protein [Candidatus Poribacteria bacterium]
MSGKHCRFERHIPAYLEGTLSDRKRRWFESNLRDSATCRREVDVYRRMRTQVAKVGVDYPDPYAWESFSAALRRRIEEDAQGAPPRRAAWASRGVDVAAGAVGGAVCGTVCAFVVVFFGLSSGLLPTRDGRAGTPDVANVVVDDPGGLTAGVFGPAASEYIVELVTVDGNDQPVQVTTTISAEQWQRLLRADALTVNQEPVVEWADSTPALDGERTPIELYGGASVFLASSTVDR